MELEFNDLPPEIHEQILMDNANLLRTARGLSKGFSDVTQRAYYRQICAKSVISKEVGNYASNNSPRIIVIYNEITHDVIESPVSSASIFILVSGGKYTLLTCELAREINAWSFRLIHRPGLYDGGQFEWYTNHSDALAHRTIHWWNTAILPFDPLTYHNILVNRGSCMRINPDYAIETTLQKFDEFVSRKQDEGTSRDHLELFNYLLALTWVFNISSPEQDGGVYGIISLPIPTSPTGIPDPNNPIIDYIIQQNHRLIKVYREIIKNLGAENIRTAHPTCVANHIFHSDLLPHPEFHDIRRLTPLEVSSYISRNPRLMIFYWEDRKPGEFSREAQHSTAWIEILLDNGCLCIRLECIYQVTPSTWSIELSLVNGSIRSPKRLILSADRVDPLTFHNIYSTRKDQIDANPNYANDTTLADFDQFIMKMLNKGSLRSEFQLFVYLMSCTWVFNISSNEQRGAYNLLNRGIPVQSNGEPDPNDPTVQEIINYNRRLIEMYREIITSLRHPGNQP